MNIRWSSFFLYPLLLFTICCLTSTRAWLSSIHSIPSVRQQKPLTCLDERASNNNIAYYDEDMESQSSRRNFILLSASSTALAATASFSSSTAPASTTTTSSTATTMNIPEAIRWIDSHCDRRFLHAVVASDYRFLYRGILPLPNEDNSEIRVRTERFAPDLLTEGTYDSSKALELFQTLQTLLKDEKVNPANGHLASSSKEDAAEWGVTAGSIWPVHDAHYAWFQDEGLFYPRPSTSTNSQIIPMQLSREDLIVDGKDCGKESLEDALRSESCEVMVASEDFLVIPACLDVKLREALKTSFLV